MFYRTLKGLGWRPGPWRYLAMAILIPICYCLLIYVPVRLSGVGRFDGSYFGKVLPFVPVALAQGLMMALGEEICRHAATFASWPTRFRHATRSVPSRSQSAVAPVADVDGGRLHFGHSNCF